MRIYLFSCGAYKPEDDDVGIIIASMIVPSQDIDSARGRAVRDMHRKFPPEDGWLLIFEDDGGGDITDEILDYIKLL